MPLIHLASRIVGTPLLIARPKLEMILSVIGSRAGLHPLALPDMDMAMPMSAQKDHGAPIHQGIAVIPVVGTLVKRTLGLDALSGLMSYDEISARLDAALAEPQVEGILLEMDSPGGEAGGVFELADRIRAAGQIKPIWAHANDAAYSAAYAIAAASERLTLSQTAGVGSVGVIALHVDQSVRDAKDGLSYTAVCAGSHKNDFSPHEPLAPQASAALQNEVDRLYDIFVTQVGQLRQMDINAVRATEAAVYFGENAVSAGLADAVMPLDQVIAEFADALAAKRRLTAPQSVRRRQASSAALPRASPQQHRSSPTACKPLLPQETTMNEHDDSTTIEPTDVDTSESDETRERPTDSATPDEAPPAPIAAAVTPMPIQPNARHEAQAIAELCLIAGTPQRTAEFLASGFNEDQVRRALLEARANQPDIASRITPDAGTTARAEDSPVVAAVKKLTAKE